MNYGKKGRKGVAVILAAILEFTFIHYFFHPENDFNGFLDPRQMQMELYWK